MNSLLAVPGTSRTLADLLHELGDISPARIRLPPHRGTATEQDLLEIHAHEKRLCELVDGLLVEKPMGYRESLLAVALATLLREFVRPRKLGRVTGEAGMLRLFPGLVRIPDVAFISAGRFPEGRVPADPVPDLAPDLAVEILSSSNTAAEMERKRREYFEAGVRLVWIIDPDARTVAVHPASKEARRLSERDALDGGDVLPGFSLPLTELFAELDEVL